jgi:hypothetical protein
LYGEFLKEDLFDLRRTAGEKLLVEIIQHFQLDTPEVPVTPHVFNGLTGQIDSEQVLQQRGIPL